MRKNLSIIIIRYNNDNYVYTITVEYLYVHV